MKFTCQQSELLFAVNTASRAVAQKSPVFALEGLLLETVNGDVKVSGYDLKMGIVCTVPAEVAESGSVVISAKLFGEIIRRLPNDSVTVTIGSDLMTHISCGMSDFEIMASSSMDYPDLPDVDSRQNLRIKSCLLKNMIAKTNFAVSYDETRPIHTGSLFEVENGTLTIVAVDGFRLALRREELKDMPDYRFVVPGTALSEVEKIAADDDSEIIIVQGDKHIMFTIGSTVLVCRRLEGEFLDYKRSVPSVGKCYVKVDRRSIIESAERVSLIITEKLKSPIRCTFGDGIIKLLTVTGIGRASDECSSDGDGEDMEIGFNNRYLLEALKAAPSDTVRFQLTSSITPCVILPDDPEDKSFVYMILPVRLKAHEG